MRRCSYGEKSAKIKILHRIIQHQPSVCSQVTTYFNAAYFHENSIFWCKLIASLAQWTRYSTEHSHHEKEGREIGSRSEWTDRYYKVINCDGIGALRMRPSLAWVRLVNTGPDGDPPRNPGQMRTEITRQDVERVRENSKLIVSTEVCARPFMMEKVATSNPNWGDNV